MGEHWHYAMSAGSEQDPAVIETMTGPEENLGKAEAKRMLQKAIRLAQQHVRYPDPEAGQAKLWEPADWWMHKEKLVWLSIPLGPNPVFAVYPCDGNCTAAAVAHRDELARHQKEAGLEAEVEVEHEVSSPGTL